MTEGDKSTGQRGQPQSRLRFETRSPFASWGDQPSDLVGDELVRGSGSKTPRWTARGLGTLHRKVANGPQHCTGQVAQPVTDEGERSLEVPSIRWG